MSPRIHQCLSALLLMLILPCAMAWRLEVGTAQADYQDRARSDRFSRVTFQQAFDTVPLVFTLATEVGDEPSLIRIKEVSTTGFVAAAVEPPGVRPPHKAMTFHYLAVTPGRHELPGGTLLEAASLDTTDVRRGPGVDGPEGWETVSFQAPFSAPPALLTQVQTLVNEANNPPMQNSVPFLSVAVFDLTSGGALMALERSQVREGSVDQPETIAWLAIENDVSGSFTDIDQQSVAFETLTTGLILRGWDDGCFSSSFARGYATPPLVLASLITRNDNDGGWLRRCALSTSGVGLTVDEDQSRDRERSRRRGNSNNFDEEAAGIAVFSRAFHADFSRIAYWPLDECFLTGTANEVRDSGPYALHGTPVGGTDTTPGRVCGAGKFVAGNGQYVRVPDHNVLDGTDQLTLMAWVYPNSIGGSPRGIISKRQSFGNNQSYSLFFWNNDRLYVDIDGNSNRLRTQRSFTPAQWYHLAMVFDGRLPEEERVKVYVDGVQTPVEPYTNGGYEQSTFIPNYNSDLTIGELDVNRGAHFDGLIDEVRLFGIALDTDAIRSYRDEEHNCPACTQLDHLEIRHDGSGLTCQPESVIIRACRNSSCSQEFKNDVIVALGPGGWVGGDTQVIDGDGDTLALRHTTAGTVTLSVSGIYPTPANPSRCYNTATGAASCELTFLDSGFIVETPAPMPLACEDSTVSIQAVSRDDNSQLCAPAFADVTRTVAIGFDYADPATGSRPLVVDGNTVAAGGTHPVDLSFDSQGRAGFTVNYRDAGTLDLHARYTGSGEDAGLELTGNDTLTVRPQGLLVGAETPAGAVLNNASSGGIPHHPAGEDFRLRVRAACADGTLTPNYRPGDFEMRVEQALPDDADTVAGTLTVAGLAVGARLPGDTGFDPVAAGFDDAGLLDEQARYSEVGVLNLQARDADYQGAIIEAPAPVTVGRFTPAYFSLASDDDGTLENICPGFTYVGQSFGYAQAPQVRITARNAQDQPTRNYHGPFAKLDESDVTAGFSTPITGTDGNLLSLDVGGAPAELTDNDDGSFTYRPGGTPFRFDKTANAEQIPFGGQITLTLADVTDADGIGNPDELSFQPAPNALRFGRLTLQDADGPTTADVTLSVFAETFDGAGYQTNLDDDNGLCTDLTADDFDLDKQPDAGTAIPDPTYNGFILGKAGLTFDCSGADPCGPGHVDITIDLEAAGFPWLRIDGDGDGDYDENPEGRVTFGVAGDQEGVIFRREVFD